MGSILALPIVIGLSFLSSKMENVAVWCKWIVAYLYLELWRRRTKNRFDLYDMDAINDPVKTNIIPPAEEFELESPKDDAHLCKASDEVFFYGINSSSECLMARVSRISPEDAEVALYLKLKNGKIYEMDHHCSHLPISKNSDRMFGGGGLKIYCEEPMRKWRIFFKGLLRESSVTDRTASKMVYVKFGLQWRAISDCYDTLSDVDSSALASALANMKWRGRLPNLKGFQDAVNSYCEGGIIRGEVYIDGVSENTEIYLFGEKIRYLGTAPAVDGYRFSHLMGQTTKNGRMIHISEVYIPSIVESLVFGFTVTPGGKIESISNINITEGKLNNGSKRISMTFDAEAIKFEMEANGASDKCKYKFGKSDESYFSMKNMTVEVNGYTGRGILFRGDIFKARKKATYMPSPKSALKDIPWVINFSDPACQIPEITGGKGSSLGKLTHTSKTDLEFIVPKGIVVTTSAYETFLTDDIIKEVKNLENVLYGNIQGNINEVCKRVSDSIISTDISNSLHQAIEENLKKEFGDFFTQKMFAVRSSATGEDSEDMSAAGQMQTFLGVSGIEKIMLSVKKCWASQFDYVAVQYKRQNGQVLNCPMAVVIQEMVTCDVAGVLFTCDPLTGNPSRMHITANYGLGESVVSGSEEPDTIILERDASNENLEVKEIIVGAKSRRTVIKDGTALSEDVSEIERGVCSLPKNLALRLGCIAISIEKSYGSERDIEWGYFDSNFYIFQSRPVTANDEETDYEIDHGNDAPLMIENEFFTVCNVGEVMPGATSLLGQEVMLKSFNATLQRKMFTHWRPFKPKYFQRGLITMYNHAMMLAADLFEPIAEGETFVKSQMFSLFGRIIEDDEMFAVIRERFGNRKKMPLFTKMLAMFMALFSPQRVLKKARKFYETSRLSLENCNTSADLLTALLNSCTYAVESMVSHLICSNKSTMSNMFLLSSLTKEKDGPDADAYNDLSLLLSSINEVESADVPSAMESLACDISKDMNAEDFRQMTAEDAQKYLLSSESDAGRKFRDFLKRHGHRCLKEFDVRTPTWGENPKQLVKLLQNLVGNVQHNRNNRKNKNFKEIEAKLKTPLSFFPRMVIRFVLLPLSRGGVQGREASKSLLIRAINEWRKGYKKLAKLMVSEGRIPDEDLLFFMSFLEIKELLRTRSPKIIARAVRRRKRDPILDSYIFPEISSGVPKPVNVGDTQIEISDENTSMKGIPVSRGVAKGFLRVALTLEEAMHLKAGEILLTYSTDIGWSPYFPTLAGLGTELGGLISHGAVVSREYGIPCIAGLHGATRKFQTGDYVLLDANKGVLSKLPFPTE